MLENVSTIEVAELWPPVPDVPATQTPPYVRGMWNNERSFEEHASKLLSDNVRKFTSLFGAV